MLALDAVEVELPKIPDNRPLACGGFSEDIGGFSSFLSIFGGDSIFSFVSSALFAYSFANSARCFS